MKPSNTVFPPFLSLRSCCTNVGRGCQEGPQKKKKRNCNNSRALLATVHTHTQKQGRRSSKFIVLLYLCCTRVSFRL